MRKLIALVMVAVATFAVGPVRAADMPYYPPIIDVPDVNYGVGGAFYLRGSAAANLWWAKSFDWVQIDCGCGGGGSFGDSVNTTDRGYGYSLGAGFGYETGTGLRADVTVDYLNTRDVTLPSGSKVALRGGLALANAYYDFNFSGLSSSAGGFGAYVGAGLGAAYLHSEVTGSSVFAGDSAHAAGALMAGVTYDMGAMVADLGYRGVYLPNVGSISTIESYSIKDNWIHEVRGTLRYRFN